MSQKAVRGIVRRSQRTSVKAAFDALIRGAARAGFVGGRGGC